MRAKEERYKSLREKEKESKKRQRETADTYFLDLIKKKEETEKEKNKLSLLEAIENYDIEENKEEIDEEEVGEFEEEDEGYTLSLPMSNPICSYLFDKTNIQTKASNLFLLSQQFCQQLDTEQLNEELGQQTIKNLAFVCRVFLNYPESRTIPRDNNASKDGERPSKKRRLTDREDDTEKKEDEKEDEEEEQFLGENTSEGNGIHWILRKLSVMCKQSFAKNQLKVRR